MRKEEIKALLRDVDEETAVQIGAEYPGLPDDDRERVFQRIALRLDDAPADEPMRIRSAPRFPWRSVSSAAACLLLLGGLSVGLFTMQQRMQEPAEFTEATGSVAYPSSAVHRIGERYAATNLTESGILWITVDKAGFLEEEPGIFIVSVTLESEDAVSAAAEITGQPHVFQADNFMLGTSRQSGFWRTVQPSSISPAGEGYPYAFRLAPGESLTLTLTYRLEDVPEELSFLTGYSTSASHTMLNIKED